MPTELRWLVSTAANSLHAARAVARCAAVADRDTSEAIADEVRGLLTDLDSLGVSRERFFEHAVAQATRIQAPSQWAKVVLAKALGPARQEVHQSQLARRFGALQAAFSKQNPGALEKLELRAGPLREQWEARGPGLLAALAGHTDQALVVESADVILVEPICGGDGAAHPLYNSVQIEALLANPRPELPEVVRLAWLLAQLNRDVPRFQGGLSGSRLSRVWQLAMIPPVLAAAGEVDLARNDPTTRAAAVSAWTDADGDAVCAPLDKWWDTYAESRPVWPVALGALERMLPVA